VIVACKDCTLPVMLQLTGSKELEMCSGDITAVNPWENRGNGDNFCEITTVITGMGTALTGIPR